MKDFQLSRKLEKLIKLARPNSVKLLKTLKNLRKGLILFPVLIFVSAYTYLLFLNQDLSAKINSYKLFHFPSFSKIAPYPLLNKVLGLSTLPEGAMGTELNLSAESVYVLDHDSKVPLFSKNHNLRFSTASTAKIMTALVALDHYRQRDVLTIFSDRVEGSVVGFKKEEKLYFKDLLFAMLLPSGNDAALAIAQNYPGGETAFIKKMNEKAFGYHLADTHFSDPTGLDDNGDYTTAVDLARLASIAIEDKYLSQVVNTKNKTITNTNGTKQYILSNLNKLLGIEGVNGIKTGFTEEAGGVLVTSRVKDKHTIIAVVMRSQDRFLDTQKILNFINGNITYQSIHP